MTVAAAPPEAAAFTTRIAALEAAADWPGLAEAFENGAQAWRTPRTVLAYVYAAVALNDLARIERAAQLAVTTTLPRLDRVLAVRRMAGAGHGMLALAILIADPDIFRDDGVLTPLRPTLRLLDAALPDRTVRVALQTAWARYANFVEAKPEPTAFTYRPATPLVGGAPGFSLDIRYADPAMAGEADSLRQLDAEFRASLAADREPSVRAWHDVFVNDIGQIWTPDRRLLRTQRWPLIRQSRAAMAGAPRLQEAVFAFSEGFNFYHWYAEWLPALAWYPAERLPLIPVLQPTGAPAFIADSLRLAFGTPVPTLAIGKATFVERLLTMPAGLPWLTRFEAYRPMLERLGAAAEQAAPGAGPRRIDITRGGAGARPLANEAAVETALAKLGVETVSFDGLPLARQIALVRGAECIVAPHGAALAHLLTARPGTKVLELMPVTPGWRNTRFVMTRLSRIVGHRHLLWLEPAHGAQERWQVHIPAMLEALRGLIAAD